MGSGNDYFPPKFSHVMFCGGKMNELLPDPIIYTDLDSDSCHAIRATIIAPDVMAIRSSGRGTIRHILQQRRAHQ
jgi:hypothetical protein